LRPTTASIIVSHVTWSSILISNQRCEIIQECARLNITPEELRAKYSTKKGHAVVNATEAAVPDTVTAPWSFLSSVQTVPVLREDFDVCAFHTFLHGDPACSPEAMADHLRKRSASPSFLSFLDNEIAASTPVIATATAYAVTAPATSSSAASSGSRSRAAKTEPVLASYVRRSAKTDSAVHTDTMFTFADTVPAFDVSVCGPLPWGASSSYPDARPQADWSGSWESRTPSSRPVASPHNSKESASTPTNSRTRVRTPSNKTNASGNAVIVDAYCDRAGFSIEYASRFRLDSDSFTLTVPVSVVSATTRAAAGTPIPVSPAGAALTTSSTVTG